MVARLRVDGNFKYNIPPMKAPYLLPTLGSMARLLIVTSFAVSGQAELRFVNPANNSEYKLGVEIPVQLSAYSPADVFASSELFANGSSFATANYCCWLCPCAAPTAGITTTLQIPAPHEENKPSTHPWQGWIPTSPGTYVLTARATGENGTLLEAPPIMVRVNVPNLHLSIYLDPDGTLRFSLLNGSLGTTAYVMELSHDLKVWDPLGNFSPGDVSAFFQEKPDSNDSRPRYYRAVAAP